MDVEKSEASKRQEISVIINRASHFVDETPTPTRLLRNCEEVGLFQDLQNVNPFEETFRKAVEFGSDQLLSVKNDIHIDDTLHTPNVFPLLPDSLPCGSTSPITPDPTPAPNRIKIEPRKQKPTPPKPPAQTQTTSDNFVIVDKNVTFKLPLPVKPAAVKVFGPKYFSVISRHHKNIRLAKNGEKQEKSQSKKPAQSVSNIRSREDILECNRLAQSRARQKKKHYMDFLERYNEELVTKNASLEEKLASLSADNALLRKKMDLMQKKCQCGDRNPPIIITVGPTKIEIPEQENNLLAERAKSFYATVPESNNLSSNNNVDVYNLATVPDSSSSNNVDAYNLATVPESSSSNNVDVHNLEPTTTAPEGSLKKPFKKRVIPPKLKIKCEADLF